MDVVTFWKRISFVLFPEETKNSSVQQGLDDVALEGTGTCRQERLVIIGRGGEGRSCRDK